VAIDLDLLGKWICSCKKCMQLFNQSARHLFELQRTNDGSAVYAKMIKEADARHRAVWNRCLESLAAGTHLHFDDGAVPEGVRAPEPSPTEPQPIDSWTPTSKVLVRARLRLPPSEHNPNVSRAIVPYLFKGGEPIWIYLPPVLMDQDEIRRIGCTCGTRCLWRVCEETVEEYGIIPSGGFIWMCEHDFETD